MSTKLQEKFEQEFKPLLKPLQQHFDIHYLGYAVVENGQYNIARSDSYFDYKFNKYTHQGCYKPSIWSRPKGLYSWDIDLDETELQYIKNHFGYHPGACIVIKRNQVIEKFSFATMKNFNIARLISDNYESFMHYTHWFREQADQIIHLLRNKNHNRHTIINNIQASKAKKKALISTLPVKRYKLTPQRNNYLTSREVDCLRHILKLESTKEASRELGISIKTIEFHLKNIMDKTGIYRRSKLYNEFNYLLDS